MKACGTLLCRRSMQLVCGYLDWPPDLFSLVFEFSAGFCSEEIDA